MAPEFTIWVFSELKNKTNNQNIRLTMQETSWGGGETNGRWQRGSTSHLRWGACPPSYKCPGHTCTNDKNHIKIPNLKFDAAQITDHVDKEFQNAAKQETTIRISV